MAAALRLLRTPEPLQAPPAQPSRGSRSGTYAITRTGPRAGSRHPAEMLPVVRGGDEERLAPTRPWFEFVDATS